LQSTSAPIFGAASTFGQGTGFKGFAFDGEKPKAEENAGEGGEEEEEAEEECAAEFQPVVQLDEVEVATGEEDEECLLDMCVLDVVHVD